MNRPIDSKAGCLNQLKPRKTLMKIIAIFSRACLCVLAMTLGLATAQATNVVKADNANILTDPAAWVGGVAPTASDIAVWNNTVQLNSEFSLGADTNWAGLQIVDPALPIIIDAGNKLTLGASGIDMSLATNGLTLANTVSNSVAQTWNVTNGQTLTVSGAISGPAGAFLTKVGNGILALSSADTYSGGTVINGGIVAPGNAASFGTGVVTNNGGSINFVNFPSGGVVNNIFNTPGTTILDMTNRNASVVLAGAFSGNGTIYVTNDTASGSTLTLGGNGSGSGNMSSFTGSIVFTTNESGLPSAGTLRFNNSSANNNVGNPAMSINLGDNSTVLLGNRNNTTVSVGELTGGPGTVVSGSVSGTGGTSIWSVGGKNTSVTFAGTFANKSATAIVALTKVGTGTYTLTGTNTFTGTLTINGGALQMGDGGADGALGSGAVADATSLIFNRSDAYIVGNNISGAGTVTIQAGGVQTYTGTNTSSGTTIISQGTLAVGSSGLMSCPIFIANGATFDVSQNPTFALNQTLSGNGSVSGLLTGIGGTISPGGAGAAGTLTFSNGVTESGNVNHAFELSSPGGTNDLINIIGDFTVSGANTITLSHFGGGIIPNGTYTLATYSGQFNGNLANFVINAPGGNGGVLANPAGQITVTITSSGRAPTSLTWVGDGAANVWGVGISNWVNGATPLAFQTGDSVRFDTTGAANSTVTLNDALLPASVTVSNNTAYTLTGAGSINDQSPLLKTSLIKTNLGTLSVLTTNSYTGQTIIGGGALVVSSLANGALPSGIGAANSDPTNLVLYGTTLAYTGSSVSIDRGATLNGSGGIFDVVGGTTLTLNGSLIGAGGLTKANSGNLILVNPNTYGNGTVISNGILALGSNNANNNGTGGSGLGATNQPVTFYGGTLQLFGYSGSTGNNFNTLYNPLIIPAGQVGTVQMFPRGPVNTGSGAGLFSSLSGGGTLNLVVNYVRDALSGNWSAFTGVINVTPKPSGSGDEMRINNNFGYANATIFLNGTVVMDSTLTSGATITIGELGGTSTATIGAGNTSQPNPTWVVGSKNTTNNFAGVIANDGTTSVIKVGTGAWILTGANTYSGSTIISNGVLSLSDGVTDGSISSSTNISIGASAFLDVSSRSDKTLSLVSGQTLSGTGTLLGSLVASGGVVSPGDTTSIIGTLTVTNAVTLNGTTWIKIKHGSTPNSDMLVAPTIDLGNSTLVVTNIGTTALHVGDTFTLFNGTLANSFATVILPNYYTWNTNLLAVNGTISVAGVALPSFAPDFSAFRTSATITFNGSNGIPGNAFNVLSSTNLTVPLGSWTNVVSGNFDGSGNYSAPVTVDPTVPTQFFILNAQ